MGGHPYWYYVDYQADLNAALQALRQREFQAGRYNPVTSFLRFPIDLSQPTPGVQHASIEKALEDADADGTRSILDLSKVAQEPNFGVAMHLHEDQLKEMVGSIHPTRKMIEDSFEDLLESIERGHGICVVVYEDSEPREILFAGYSYD